MKNSMIIRRLDALKSERSAVESLWEMIERFALPFRGEFYNTVTNENEVDWHRRDVYDSTVVFAVQALAASLQGNLTSPSQKWFDLTFKNKELNNIKAAKEWLESTTKRIFDALQESNFNIEMSEAYIDLVGFGTSVLTEEVVDELDWKGINFQSIPIKEFFFEEDHEKQVSTLYRSMAMTPVQMISRFGEDGVTAAIRKRAESPEGGITKEEVVFCIFQRPDKKDADTSKVLAPKNRPFGFKYVVRNGQSTLGEEGGYYEMPAFVSRWRKVSGSKWGHGPVAVAMGDVLTTNQLVEATFDSLAKVIDPVTLAEQTAVEGTLDLDRGGYNIVNDINGIRTHESGAKFEPATMSLHDLRESIKQALHQDELALKESPAMTATEANIRYELMQRLLGPTLGRLINDLLDPLIQRTFNILYRAKQLDDIPEGLTIGEMDIEYTGPLPRAQKVETANSIRAFLLEIAEMAEVYPDAVDIPNVDDALREIATLRGVPATSLNSKKDVKNTREGRAAAAQQRQGVIDAGEAGNAAQAMGAGADAMGVDKQQILKAVGKSVAGGA